MIRAIVRGYTMRENRRFIRVAPRGLVSKVATIIVDPKKPVISCNVIDQSAGGACLEVCGQAAIPKKFILLHAGTRKTCKVVWQVGRRLGVSY